MRLTKSGLILVGLIIFCEGTMSDLYAKNQKLFSPDAQSALQSLGDAWRRKDIKEAARRIDFRGVSRFMLIEMDKGKRLNLQDDKEILDDMEVVVESDFYKYYDKNPVPEFIGLVCHIQTLELESDVFYIAKERCNFPEGGYSLQMIRLVKRREGWLVVGPVSEPEV
jgi:hypothetical protein